MNCTYVDFSWASPSLTGLSAVINYNLRYKLTSSGTYIDATPGSNYETLGFSHEVSELVTAGGGAGKEFDYVICA